MYTLTFSALAAALFAYGYLQHRGPSWIWWWLGSLFVVYVFVRYFAHHRSRMRLGSAFDTLYEHYRSEYGNTSSGQRFLSNTKAWHEGMFTKGLELSLSFGDWKAALIGSALGAVTEGVGSYLSNITKSAEQNELEMEITALAQEISDRSGAFGTGMIITTMSYVSAAAATFMLLVPTNDFEKTPLVERSSALAAQNDAPASSNTTPTMMTTPSVVPESNHKGTSIILDVSAKNDSIPNQLPEVAIQTDYVRLTSTDGRVIQAKILALSKDTVIIKRDDGQQFEISLDRITPESKVQIEAYRELRRKTAPP